MILNYFKLAWRNLVKDRQFSFLNLLGLSIGLTCTLLIFLWVKDETRIDHFFDHDNRLLQVLANHKEAGLIKTIPSTPAPLAEALEKEIPEVQYAVSAFTTTYGGGTTLSNREKSFRTNGFYAGKDYFHVFSYKLIDGDIDHVLTDKRSIVISRSLALRLFNTTAHVVGKTIEYQHEQPLMISGIFQDPPANGSVQFDFLLSLDVAYDIMPYLKEWGNSDPYTYVLLKEGVQADQFNKKIAKFIESKVTGSNITLISRRYSDGYLYNNYENGVQSGGRITYVRLFSIIAVFILLIACINFMNLSTAKATQRVKEVGIRKVMGALRSSLIFQYIIESLALTFLSLLLALVAVYFLLPTFNNITGKQLALDLSYSNCIYLLAIIVCTGLIAGSYPAFYLSRFNPVVSLKGKLRSSLSEVLIRKGLVVFQFTLSAIFIISVLVVYKQLRFIQSKNMGFDKDHVVSINMEGNGTEKIVRDTRYYLEQIKNIPGIANASSMDHSSIIADFGSTSGLEWAGKDPGQTISFANIGVNYDLIETLNMQVAAGRPFSKKLSADTNEIMLNEAAVAAMGIKDPVGKKITMWGSERRIVGVIRNFHYESVHETIKPFIFRLEPTYTFSIIARIKEGTETQTLQQLEQLYNKVNPGFAFNFKFLDQDYQAQYVAEKRAGALSGYFAGLAIAISCLGLFGLAAFTAQKRQKEIGIRKVVGATVKDITTMLSAEFLKLVGIAILIATPLGWWALHKWLEGFAYRIDVSASLFIISGFAVILISMLTVATQAIKASLISPAKSLRAE